MVARESSPIKKTARRSSLRLRIALISMLSVGLALLATGYVLNQLFESQVRQQYQRQLQVYADYVLADLGPDIDGQLQLERAQQNPRFVQPLSGLYWQINDEQGRVVLRSRSLWDQEIETLHDALSDGQAHFHLEPGPGGGEVFLLEQVVRFDWDESRSWRLLVAQDAKDLMASIQDWRQSLMLYLSVLFVGLSLAVLAQGFFGLAPLGLLQQAVISLRQGEVNRLRGQYPSEFMPLVDDFNHVLQVNEKMLDNARAQAGDLAHAIKTPITIMTNATARAQREDFDRKSLLELIAQQLHVLQSTVEWRLRRSTLKGQLSALPGHASLVEPVIQQLFDVMRKLHVERTLALEVSMADPKIEFAGDSQDLVELLGNLIDNACKWAKHKVSIAVAKQEQFIVISVEDDGPGIEPEQLSSVIRRGTRFDERVPGSGLGLAIVQDLVDMYEGSLTLRESRLGGLLVVVELPAKNMP